MRFERAEKSALLFYRKLLTFRTYYYNIVVQTRKGVNGMSPRPKSDKSKHNRFELRLNDEMNEMLNECSERLNTTKTEVINKGIRMVKNELDKK